MGVADMTTQAIFTVTANAYTKDKEALTCLTGAVDFRQPK